MSDNQVARWAGGSPLGVLVRLILVSILVGVILSALGLDPFDIIHSVERLIRSIWNMGFDAIRLAVALFPAGGGDRHPDLVHHAHGQCATRPINRELSRASFPR